MHRSSPAARRLLLVAGGLLLGLVFLEPISRLYLSVVTPRVPPTVWDARLGYRGNPAYPGMDSKGWRNASALPKADVVVLGDSHTYGYNAPVNGAWPQRLGDLLHRTVYQMALGGYGPAHHALLVEEALSLRPSIVLGAYYLGNDLYDGYALAYRADSSAIDIPPRGPQRTIVDTLVTPDPKIREAISQADARWGLLRERLPTLNCQNVEAQAVDHAWQNWESAAAASAIPGTRISSSSSTQRLLRMLNYSATFRIVWPRLRPRLDGILGETGPADSDLCISLGTASIRTYLNVGYRLAALNERDPRIVEGEQIDLQALRYMAGRFGNAGIRFYLVVIPTKESAFRRAAQAAGPDHPELLELWEAEDRARSRATVLLRREGVQVIDALPALQALVATGTNPYPVVDGHPNAAGYDAIARQVARQLEHDRRNP